MSKLVSKKLLIILFFLFSTIITSQNIDARTIKNYDIDLKVKDNGLIEVKQKLNVNFDTPGHGIYAKIPTEYFMKWSDDDTRRYFFPVSHVNVKDYPFEVDNQSSGVFIKIGDPEKYLKGLQTFEYSYQIQTKDLNLNNQQMLYFNLVGDLWSENIENVSFSIDMPKPFKDKPEFVTTNTYNKVNYSIKNDDTITGSVNSTFNPGDALTIKLDLPDNYFNYPINKFLKFSTIILVIMAIISFISIVMYFKNRRVKLIPILEFKAPHNLSSAQVAYIYHGKISLVNMSSLFIYWASKGYLKIKEKKDGFTDVITFTKLKDIDESEMEYEQKLFKKFFKKNTVKSNNIPEEFSKALSGSKYYYEKFFKNDLPLFKEENNFKKALLAALILILFGSFIGISTYEDSYFLPLTFMIILVFSIPLAILSGFYIKSVDSLYIKRNFKRISKLFALSVLFLVYLLASSIIFFTLSDLTLFHYLIAYLLTIITIFFSSHIRRRSDDGIKLLQQVLGLREFIKTAEKSKLEALVNENPEYFYDILPYAYVFNISKKWSRKFENITTIRPEWYQSNNILSDVVITSAITNSISRMNSSISSGISSTVSSSSGGFSSSGGGSAGGGFGGGGGGTW